MPTQSNVSLTIAVLVLSVLSLAAGCETSNAERTEASTAPARATSLGTGAQQRLIERAQAVRDRTFEEPPTLEGVEEADDLGADRQPADRVAAERALLVAQLFGRSVANSKLATPTPAYRHIARFDAGQNRVVYIQDHPDEGARDAAIVAALVEALDAQHFDSLPEPTSWDEQLALAAAEHATVSFALAQHLLASQHPDVEGSLLATRPELAAELDVLDAWLGAASNADNLADRLAARQQAFVLREGLALGAALHRSSGWSGVELSRLMPPSRTADVVRPDQWMSGEPTGIWEWPEDEDEDTGPRAGRVGPAVAAMWLEDVVAPQLARTTYAGYISDAYRFYEETDEAPARFEWLSVWNAPDSAQQVARAFEKRLRKRFEDEQNTAAHFVVFQKGLEVGVIISELPEAEKRARAQHLLDAHKLTLQTRDGLPTSFVPTRRDQLDEEMQAATLNGRVWRDPATKLRLDLDKLGDDWTVQQPDRGPVRWFASHPDGSLLQLTVELDNPLGPRFSSDAYRERLVDAFQSSLRHAKLQQVAPTDKTPSRGLLVHIVGEVENTPRTLLMWQFVRDDLIVSYSLQAPPEAFDDHKAVAEAILDNAGSLDTTVESDQRAPGEPNGIIQYEVEE